MKSKISPLIFSILAICSQSFAGNVNHNFQSTATLSSSCLVSVTNISFGSITPSNTGVAKATGSITSTCSKGLSYSLAINGGSSDDTSTRTLVGTNENTDQLTYNIYTDSSLQNVWEDGINGPAVNLVGTGTSQLSTIYGALELHQYFTPGNYTDNLTLTLSY